WRVFSWEVERWIISTARRWATSWSSFARWKEFIHWAAFSLRLTDLPLQSAILLAVLLASCDDGTGFTLQPEPDSLEAIWTDSAAVLSAAQGSVVPLTCVVRD